MDPKMIKKTQDTLGKLIKKPPLTEKLLSKPPFRFLHDIVTSVVKTTGFMQGLFTDGEMNSENVKDKDTKCAFLQKEIDFVSAVLGKNLSVKPAKIVAGHEPEKTNELLQCLADAINKNVDNDEYVRRVLKGGGGGGSAKEERKEKDRTKSADRRKSRDPEEKHEEKKDKDRERSRDKGDKERKHDKEDKDRRHDKDRDKDRKERHKDRDGEKESSKSRDKSRDGRDREERHRDRDRSRKEPKPPHPAAEGELKHKTRISTNSQKDSRGKSSSGPQTDRTPEKMLNPTHQRSPTKTNYNGRDTCQGESEGVTTGLKGHNEKGSDKVERLESKRSNQTKMQKPDGGAAEKGKPSSDQDGDVRANHRRAPSGDQHSPKMACGLAASRDGGLSKGAGHPQGDGPAPHVGAAELRDQSGEKENESPATNGEREEKQEAPARLARPASAKGSRRRREAQNHSNPEDEEFHQPPAQDHQPVMGEDALPPQVAAARLARPSSARPAPPRPKQEAVESEPAMRLGTGQPANLIVDNGNEDDDEDLNFLVEESAPAPEPTMTLSKPQEEEDEDHGALVKKMLESKKELEGGSINQQTGPNKKTEIERPAMSDAQRRKQREIVQKEVEKLRGSIQGLTRSANPLGKVMDYVQEDLDSMQQELDKWKTENTQHALDLKRETSVTDRAIEPLRQQLTELERTLGDQLDQIAAVKANIIRNDVKISKMLRGIAGS